MTAEAEAVRPVEPLLAGDPPRLGDVDLLGRLAVTGSAVVYAGVLSGEQVAVVMLSTGAELDSFARARFHDAVTAARAGSDEVTAQVLATADDPQIAPWAAIPAESWDSGIAGAIALLTPVTLADRPVTPPADAPRFEPPWHTRPHPGRWRLWPLPWPAKLTSERRWTWLVAFLFMLALAALALLITVWILSGRPPTTPPPPYPQPTTPTPSQQSQSPTPSPTPTPTGPSGGQGSGAPPII